jgi:hypothetical protein
MKGTWVLKLVPIFTNQLHYGLFTGILALVKSLFVR